MSMELNKYILLAFLIVFIVIQFIQPAHNISGQGMPMDIIKTVSVPDNVLNILNYWEFPTCLYFDKLLTFIFMRGFFLRRQSG